MNNVIDEVLAGSPRYTQYWKIGVIIMSNKTYDLLKNLCLVVIPFFAFISTLCGIWNVPYTEQITGTLVALETFLGALVKIANTQYNAKKEAELQETRRLNAQD